MNSQLDKKSDGIFTKELTIETEGTQEITIQLIYNGQNKTYSTKYVKQKTYEYNDNIEFPEKLNTYIKNYDTVPQNDYENFYQDYDNAIEKQKNNFNDWKNGNWDSIDLFVTQNH